MKLNLFFFLLLSLAGYHATFAQAVPNSHYAAAAELSSQVQQESYTSMISTVIDMQAKLMPAEQQPVFKAAMAEFLTKYLSWETMKDMYAKIYMALFTESEIRDILAFYKTPAGTKLMRKTPEIMALGTAAGQKAVMDHQPELLEIMRKHMNSKPGN